jgi:hypothetical protein
VVSVEQKHVESQALQRADEAIPDRKQEDPSISTVVSDTYFKSNCQSICNWDRRGHRVSGVGTRGDALYLRPWAEKAMKSGISSISSISDHGAKNSTRKRGLPAFRKLASRQPCQKIRSLWLELRGHYIPPKKAIGQSCLPCRNVPTSCRIGMPLVPRTWALSSMGCWISSVLQSD